MQIPKYWARMKVCLSNKIRMHSEIIAHYVHFECKGRLELEQHINEHKERTAANNRTSQLAK